MKTAQPSWRIAYPEVPACATWGAISTVVSAAARAVWSKCPVACSSVAVTTEDLGGMVTKLGSTKPARSLTATMHSAATSRLEEVRRAIWLGARVYVGRGSVQVGRR